LSEHYKEVYTLLCRVPSFFGRADCAKTLKNFYQTLYTVYIYFCTTICCGLSEFYQGCCAVCVPQTRWIGSSRPKNQTFITNPTTILRIKCSFKNQIPLLTNLTHHVHKDKCSRSTRYVSRLPAINVHSATHFQ